MVPESYNGERENSMSATITESKEKPNVKRSKRANEYKDGKKIVRDDILTIVPSTFCDPSLKPIKGRFLLRFLLTRAFYSNWFHFFPSTYHNIALLQLSIIPSRNPLCIKFLS